MAGPGVDPVDRRGRHGNLGYLPGGRVAGCYGATPMPRLVCLKGSNMGGWTSPLLEGHC